MVDHNVNDLDDTVLEFSSLDPTAAESGSRPPIRLIIIERHPIVIVEIENNIPGADDANEPPPICELIAHTFLELNKVQLPQQEVIHIRNGMQLVPVGIGLLIMSELSKRFKTVKVYCEKTDTYETVSL